MSKQFEDDYKQMMQENIPDLWSRIEAGLKDKNLDNEINNNMNTITNITANTTNTATDTANITNTATDTANNATAKSATKGRLLSINWNKISKYSTIIVAACLCVAVIIPVFLWGRNSGTGSADTTAAVAGGIEESTMMAESLESTEPLEAEDRIAEQEFATQDSTAATEESATATEEGLVSEAPMGIMEDSSEVNAQTDEASTQEAKDASDADTGMALEGSYETVIGDSGQEFLIDNITYFQVDIKITSYKKFTNAYYQGEIISSSGDLISSASVIKLYVGEFEQTLVEKQTYTLIIMDNMEPTDSKIHDYTIMDKITQ